jgi:outer membrane protein assembly factor BamB
MAAAQPVEPTLRKPLRVWPGVAAVIVQWIGWVVVPVVAPDAGMAGMLAAIAMTLAIIVWWLFFSRASWAERVGAIVLMVVGIAATFQLVHDSISNGMMGFMLYVYALPVLCLALVAWAVAARRLSAAPRRAWMVGSILLACGVFTTIRTEGLDGDGESDLHWRWTPTAEERLLAQAADAPRASSPRQPAAPQPPATAVEAPKQPSTIKAADPRTPVPPAPADTKTPDTRVAVGENAIAAAPDSAAVTVAEWPGFRGPERDGIIRGARIETDWSRLAPIELWRRPIGPGWSSFAVAGNYLYTQEQRGEEEIVSSYNLTTGASVWQHGDRTRFWESNAGAGPRGTPTLHGGRVYTFGATGILNALDARSGAVVWSRNVASEIGRTIPDWGFASSPLIVGDTVVVAAAGVLAAYDLAAGNPRWIGPKEGSGYSSPHLTTIAGVPQIVLLNGDGAIGVAPLDGALLWKHDWRSDGIVQPAVISGSDVLVGSGSGLGAVGMRRLAIAHGSGGWTVQERWTSNGLKPYYNDFVVHNGHAFGFDGSLLACIDLADGARKWKGGRYGHGQLVLLPEQDLLLVASEDGELALVKAATDGFTELARFAAIEGKTWNHPVLVRDVVLVRNAEEMAAFRLPVAAR